MLLANVAGEMSVEEACRALGLRKSRFFELRKQWLQESMQALEPEPPGRPVELGRRNDRDRRKLVDRPRNGASL